MDRFAVIADVHGNRWALEAVLEDIARHGVRDIVNAGDHLWGPLDPAGTADLLMRLALPSVAGNQDRELIDDTSLSEAHRSWLASLPLRLRLDEQTLMFHGTPTSDDVYLLETVRAGGLVTSASNEEIVERLGNVSEMLLLCGHTHIPRVVELPNRTIVNPGSVGLQAYPDDHPLPHLMGTGSPRARYAIVERRETGWNVELVAIDYDFESAAQTAERNGRPDWGYRLRTGRVPPQ
jgi:putative phosphoesterase